MPIVGAWSFFSKRWDFCREAARNSAGKSVIFFAGQYPVVALAGVEQRKVFFEHKGLDFNEGYSTLLGGSPPGDKNEDFGIYFRSRLLAMLKGPVLKAGLPQLIRDTRRNLDAMKAEPSGRTDPFESIYRIVFQLTMRTVACHEIADDPKTLATCLHCFETIDKTGTPLTVMFPWMPLPAKFQRLKVGAQLYMIFQSVIEKRKKEEVKQKDALQFLLDQGDDAKGIITFVLGALFAGQLNSGINAAYIMCHLACNEEWRNRVREEVERVANQYTTDESLPLADRLESVPIDAWESDFPMIDLCLKDSIRMHMPGAAFRRNTSGQDIPLPGGKGEIIPKDAFVTYAVGDAFYNPEVYKDEKEFDPSRYLPERAEDKKEAHAWFGWGAGRHPCLGMRFAKLENNVIAAFFLAYFDKFSLEDAAGRTLTRVPDADRNAHSASKPKQKLFLNLTK